MDPPPRSSATLKTFQLCTTATPQDHYSGLCKSFIGRWGRWGGRGGSARRGPKRLPAHRCRVQRMSGNPEGSQGGAPPNRQKKKTDRPDTRHATPVTKQTTIPIRCHTKYLFAYKPYNSTTYYCTHTQNLLENYVPDTQVQYHTNIYLRISHTTVLRIILLYTCTEFT